ncbi:MAG: hypothetical protein GC201_04145 [Alphaproteobacteria bacterium]|nr:hypothetical protein [Alphaproteobacteria bacterium]
MTTNDPAADLHKRIDDLEGRIAAVRSERGLRGQHEEQAEALQEEARVLRRRITGAYETTWEDVKEDLHRDWQALNHSVERWMERVETDYAKGRR